MPKLKTTRERTRLSPLSEEFHALAGWTDLPDDAIERQWHDERERLPRGLDPREVPAWWRFERGAESWEVARKAALIARQALHDGGELDEAAILDEARV